jgi:anti-sigma factor ChrR (cupin superfamily)
MSPHHPLGEPAELAALYAAGAFPDHERTDYEVHLAEGCAACNEELSRLNGVVAALSAGLPAVTPPSPIRDSLLRRIAATREAVPSGRELFILKAEEGAWEQMPIPGMQMRKLFVDEINKRMTALVRMAPGSSYPIHLHHGPEECLVLEGDLRVGDHVLRAGDYQRAPAGTRHGIQSTEHGCLILVTASLDDEIC